MSSVKIRQKVEREIVSAAVHALLKAGFLLNTDYGDSDVLDKPTADRDTIIKELFQGDDDRIYVYTADDLKAPEGWVWAVYGNDGWDVISDYTVNLEPYIGEGTVVDKLIESYSD